MATQLDIKRRIRSVKNTQQITRAMKFVAAARLAAGTGEGRCGAALRARHHAAWCIPLPPRAPESNHPLLPRRPEKRVLLLAVSGERGLVRGIQCQRDSPRA